MMSFGEPSDLAKAQALSTELSMILNATIATLRTKQSAKKRP